MSDVLVSLQGVSKRYPLVHRNSDRMRAMLRGGNQRRSTRDRAATNTPWEPAARRSSGLRVRGVPKVM